MCQVLQNLGQLNSKYADVQASAGNEITRRAKRLFTHNGLVNDASKNINSKALTLQAGCKPLKVFAFNPILEELFDTPPTSPQSSRVTKLLEIEGNPEKTGSPLMSSSVCKKRGKAATACVQVSCYRHCLSAWGNKFQPPGLPAFLLFHTSTKTLRTLYSLKN